MAISREALEARISDVNALMSAHAGAVELLDVGADGTVTVMFTGKCRGCEVKPLTMAATVRPALLAVEGVTEVLAAGTRVSEEAARRMAEAFGPDDARIRWMQMIHERRRNPDSTE
jgi:Fe-S cluster biogenesis protein NfuA